MTQSPTGEQAVAVLGLPDLARALTAAGVRVVTGETFRSAAAAVNAQLKIAPIGLILADVAIAGTLPWLEKVLRGPAAAVLVGVDLTAGQARIAGNTAQATRIPAPVGLEVLLAAVGLSSSAVAGQLQGDGSVTTAPPAVAADTVDAPPPAPAAPMLDEDAWGLDEVVVELPVPQMPAEPAPALEVVPVAAPEPVAPTVSAPAQARLPPMPLTPMPVAPAVPAQDFWGTPAPSAPHIPTAPHAPAPLAPAWGPPAAPAAPEPAWEQLVSPAAPIVVSAPVRAPSAVEQIGVASSYSPALGRDLARVLVTLAGKGGVGKTSLALALAQRAAVVGRLRVVLIDANRGQGDLRIYLSLNNAGLPTVYDAVTTGNPAAAIVTPDQLNANRPAGAEQLGIALVQAPPHGLADPTVITAALYHDIITVARGMADLVVIDTQIVEGAERGLFDELVVPMLHSHAYGLGIADLSKPGVDNLVTHLKEFIAQGVPVTRLMTMLNRVPSTTEFDLQKTSDALSRYGVFLASVPADADLHAAMAYGTSIQDNPVLAPVLDKALMRVTGNPVFTALPPLAPAATKKRGFFRRGRAA